MAGLNNDNNPIQTQVRLGPQLIQLVPGPPGPPGPAGGVITTSASFTQPAIGASVAVSVSTTAGLATGLDVFVQGGGYYQVASVGGPNTVTLVNLGTPGININPGLTVNNGAILSPSGPPLLVSPAHSVLLGEGASPVIGIGPATSGLALVAQGASADPAFGVLPWSGGGRLQGILHVVNGTPGVLSPTAQIALAESNTGSTSVSIPTAAQFGGTIPDGFSFMMADTGGAGGTANITLTNATALRIVNPNTLTAGTGSVVLRTNWASSTWTWDATELVFFLSSGAGSGAFGTIGNGGAVVTTTYTLLSTDYNTLIAAGSQVTGPAAPIVGATYKLTTASGDFQATPAQFIGNGYNVYSPNPTNAYDNASQVALKVSGASPAWWWDGTVMRLA